MNSRGSNKTSSFNCFCKQGNAHEPKNHIYPLRQLWCLVSRGEQPPSDPCVFTTCVGTCMTHCAVCTFTLWSCCGHDKNLICVCVCVSFTHMDKHTVSIPTTVVQSVFGDTTLSFIVTSLHSIHCHILFSSSVGVFNREPTSMSFFTSAVWKTENICLFTALFLRSYPSLKSDISLNCPVMFFAFIACFCTYFLLSLNRSRLYLSSSCLLFSSANSSSSALFNFLTRSELSSFISLTCCTTLAALSLCLIDSSLSSSLSSCSYKPQLPFPFFIFSICLLWKITFFVPHKAVVVPGCAWPT